MKELLGILDQLAAPENLPAVLATLVSVQGSSYRRAGARLLFTARGPRTGSISGGCLEEDVIARARRVLTTGRPELATYDTTSENDLVWGVGLGCNGIVDVFLEPLQSSPPWVAEVTTAISRGEHRDLEVIYRPERGEKLGTRLAKVVDMDPAQAPSIGIFRQTVTPPPHLVIFGAGDDAQPLVRLSKELGWVVTVADPRPAFATRDRFPEADQVIVAAASQAPAAAAVGPRSLVVVMTHHYVHDVPLLAKLLPLELPYLGLLGPKKRAEKIIADLVAQGVLITPAMRARLHAPVGLDLGGDAPEMVALAMVAEMQSILAGRDARPLRERVLPIHA